MGQLQILKASAGSGKTFMLAYEYVKNVIAEPVCYKNILAVTFTKKATAEMKSRILDELFNLTQATDDRAFLEKLILEENFEESDVRIRAKKALNFILHDYSNFSVMTIDGFFQKIVRSFIKELHLECDYTIDFNINYLLKLSIDNLIKKSDNDPQLKAWIEAFIDDTIEASKRVDIRKDILSLSKMVLSETFDKSYFEKHRDKLIEFFNHLTIIEKQIKESINDKAHNFIKYCDQNNLTVTDLPGKSTGIFSYIKKVSNGTITRCSDTVAKLSDTEKKWSKLSDSDTANLRTIFGELTYIIDQNIKYLNSIEAVLSTHRTFVLLADISSELNELCKSNNKMLISNTNYLINKLVRNNDAPYIYEKIGNNYQIIMIDEFQDTSTGQWENFRPLLENSLSEAPSEKATVTLVGDVKQSIYRWRGGDWRILGGEVNSAFYGVTIKEEHLVKNYRSRSEIINFNNSVIRGCAESLNSTINSTLEELREKNLISIDTLHGYRNILTTAYENLEQELPSQEKKGGYVEVIKYIEDDNLAHTVRVIKELQDSGYKASDIAILVRNKKSAKKITSYILDYKRTHEQECENYCFDVIASDGLSLNRSTMVKFIMSVYTLSHKPTPTQLALYNRYLDRELLMELPGEEVEFIATLQHLPAVESFEKIVERFSLGDNTNNIAYLQAFHTAIISFSGDQTADVASLLEWWNSESDNLSVSLPEGQNAINIETIHKSKGLQYNVVILPYCNWSLPPMSRDNFFWASTSDKKMELPESDGQKIIIPYKNSLAESFFSEDYLREYVLTIIENFNIFYVALTRAKSELYIMLPEESRKGININQFVEEVIGENVIYGNKTSPKRENSDNSAIYIKKFNHCDISSRIAIHTESDKFFKDMEESEPEIDARGKGILLHKLFEEAAHLEDIPTNIDRLLASGYISKEEAGNLKVTCNEAMNNPTIQEWFDIQWETRNESAILLPSTNSSTSVTTNRPDRVLLKGDNAIVVDYKFGVERTSHRKQIIRYKELLQSMGYNNIRGYLWYINKNIIAEV